MSKHLCSVVLSFFLVSLISGCASDTDESQSQQNNQISGSTPSPTTDPIASILNEAAKNPAYTDLPSVEEIRSSTKHMSCFVAAQSIGASEASYCKTNKEVEVCQWIYKSVENQETLFHQLVDENCDKVPTTTVLYCEEAVSRFPSSQM
jgi:hypothetical protein